MPVYEAKRRHYVFTSYNDKKHFMTQSSAPAPYEAIDGTSIKCAASESLTINI